jgi:hypothetical protein
MTLQQGAFQSMFERDGQRTGWNGSFERLAEHVRKT